MDSSVSPYWAVVLTRPLGENRALTNLERQGFTAYAPRLIERKGSQEKPAYLFPRYLFVRIESQWRCVLSTYGVCDVVRTGISPTPLPDRDMAAIKAMEDADGYIRLGPKPKPGSPFQEGQLVRVDNGPFQGYTGLYAGMTAKAREGVLLEFLGSQRHVPLHFTSLTAA